MNYKTAWSAVGIALAGAMALGASAQAADLGGRHQSYKDEPVYNAPTNWSGVYIGGQLGGAWGDVDVTDVRGDGSLYANGAIGSSGVIGGGQLGVNWQAGAFVFGLESDLGGLDRSSSIVAQHGATYAVSGGFYGDFTGRLGVALDRTLLYGKGGAAFLNSNSTVDYTNGHHYKSNDTDWGWTAGGGAEFLITPSWSIKAEYLHFDFGDKSITTNIGADNGSASFNSNTVDAVTAGVNYHFGRGYSPLK